MYLYYYPSITFINFLIIFPFVLYVLAAKANSKRKSKMFNVTEKNLEAFAGTIAGNLWTKDNTDTLADHISKRYNQIKEEIRQKRISKERIEREKKERS